MNEQTERIEIKKVHDNDKYIIKQILTQEVDGSKLVEYRDNISKALEDTKKAIESLPKEQEGRAKYNEDILKKINDEKEQMPELMKQRKEALEKDIEKFELRLKAFNEHAEKIKPLTKEENQDETDINQNI